jgi:hypothetical protein
MKNIIDGFPAHPMGVLAALTKVLHLTQNQ